MTQSVAQITALDPTHHQQLQVKPALASQQGQTLQLVPVVPSEFAFAATQLPLFITKHELTGEFSVVAMTGFAPGENLWWQGGAWQAAYLPLQLQRLPFFLGHAENEAPTLCIDLANPAVSEGPVSAFKSDTASSDIANSDTVSSDTAEPLFVDGKPSAYLQQMQAILAELWQGEQNRRELLTLIADWQLLQPVALDITFANQQQRRLQGLYSIDAAKLAALTPEQVVLLHQRQWLSPLYAMCHSMSQLYVLIEMKNATLASSATEQAHGA